MAEPTDIAGVNSEKSGKYYSIFLNTMASVVIFYWKVSLFFFYAYIERSDDANTIFGKSFDFSPTTLEKLKDRGRLDAEFQIEIEEVFTDVKDLLNNGDMVKAGTKVYELEQIVQKIKLSIRHGDVEEIKANLMELIRFINKNAQLTGRKSKIDVDKVNRLIELSKNFNI